MRAACNSPVCQSDLLLTGVGRRRRATPDADGRKGVVGNRIPGEIAIAVCAEASANTITVDIAIELACLTVGGPTRCVIVPAEALPARPCRKPDPMAVLIISQVGETSSPKAYLVARLIGIHKQI